MLCRAAGSKLPPHLMHKCCFPRAALCLMQPALPSLLQTHDVVIPRHLTAPKVTLVGRGVGVEVNPSNRFPRAA